jgi:hypothetical protein
MSKMDQMNGIEYGGAFENVAIDTQRAGSFSSSTSSIQHNPSQNRFNAALGRWRSANGPANSRTSGFSTQVRPPTSHQLLRHAVTLYQALLERE